MSRPCQFNRGSDRVQGWKIVTTNNPKFINGCTSIVQLGKTNLRLLFCLDISNPLGFTYSIRATVLGKGGGGLINA
jgi:hypothetical protein